MNPLVIRGDARHLPLPDGSVDLIVTSPPYWALRDYRDGDESMAGQIGSEPTWQEWLATMVECTAEWARVLKPSGSMFVNLGDKYSTGNSGQSGMAELGERWAGGGHTDAKAKRRSAAVSGMPPKCLLLLPERYAIAATDQLGLILRRDIIWNKPNCLSGGTTIYAKVKGRPTTIKVHDLCRAYAPEQVQLWNGQRWTQVLWWQPTGRHPESAESMKAIRAARRRGDEPVPAADVEIELRSGERIGCTREHRWPTQRGLVEAADLAAGDVLDTCPMPEGETAPAALDDEMIGWFVGLYIAEGSHGSDQTIQVAGHVKEAERYKRLRELAEAYHATCMVYATHGNAATINLTGRFLDAIIDTYVGGRTAKDKHLRPACWQRSNRFLRAVLDGYLSGDGHWRKDSRQWVLGFTDNDALAADLRSLGARLSLSVRLTRCTHTGFGKEWPGWRGTITEPQRRRQPDSQIVAIRQSRARQFWDIGVEDEPHLFALASGVLTHNSLPESVTDRCRSSHEYLFHLVKQPRYYAAVDEIREPQLHDLARVGTGNRQGTKWQQRQDGGDPRFHAQERTLHPLGKLPGSVWSIPSQPLTVPAHLGIDHFAAFPMELPRRCILGWSPPGVCVVCGEGRRPVVGADWAKIPHRIVEKRAYTAAELGEFGRLFGRWWRSKGVRRADFVPLFPHYKNPDSVMAQVSNWDLGKNVPSVGDWLILSDWLGEPPSRLRELVHLTRPLPTAGGFGGSELSPGTGLQLRHKTGQGMTSASAPPKTITGYACACPQPTAPTTPSVVLDPFGGTGTTALVAAMHGRTGITIDRSADYSRLAAWRTTDPAQRAAAMGVPKPPPIPDGMEALF